MYTLVKFSQLKCKFFDFSLREKCSHLELFWSAFSRIRTFLRIQSKCEKMRTRTILNTDTFCTMFRVLGSKCFKFLRPILNCQVNSYSNFASFFIVVTHSSPVNFKDIHFLLWVKGPSKSPHFETFVCTIENLSNSWCRKSVFAQILHHSLVSWKITRPYFFSSNIYFVQEQPIELKCKFLRLSSAQVKIHQIPYVNLETASQFLFRFFIILQCHYKELLCKYLAHVFST